MKKHLPIYEIEGNHKQIGEFLGSTFRNDIQDRIIERKKLIKNYSQLLSESKKCFVLTKEYLPDLIEESEAIAHAADVDLLDYFFINNREVFDISSLDDHCTIIAGFDDGKLIIGQNEDWSIDALDKIYILKAKIAGTTFIGLNYKVTIPGLSASMNSYGLVQCISDLNQINCIGVPRNYIARAILEAKTIAEAESIIRKIPKASGFNHVLAQNDEIRNVEIAGDHINVESIRNGPYAHTNHYLNQGMQKYEESHTQSSLARFNRATELVKENMPLDYIKSILADTQNSEFPICIPDKTIGSVIFQPDKLKGHFCYGHPCAGEYISYDLL